MATCRHPMQMIPMVRCDPGSQQAELALVAAMGGRSYRDASGRIYHVAESMLGWPIGREPLTIQGIPDGWMEVRS